jgi:hypothetical protein
MADTPGDLSLLNMATGSRETLDIDWSSEDKIWGEEDCPAPQAAAFSPHGIDLTIRDDGATSLLVVNHGAREAVEFFEVAPSGDLTWRGCAIPPEDPSINDVAGESTGWVWEWTPEGGFAKLPNTDDLMPNGIAINADNTTLFVNVYIGNKAFAVDRLPPT